MCGRLSRGSSPSLAERSGLPLLCADAHRINARLVLIDGDDLGDLMVSNYLGVQVEETFTLKEIDEDFFEA